MSSLSAELRQIKLMSVVTVRKKSFCEGNAAQTVQGKGEAKVGGGTVPSHLPEHVGSEVINSETTNDSDDSSDDSSGGSSEQLSSPGILSPVITSLADESCSTWPRKYRKASVRFTEDPVMVRQKETRSRLAAASSTDWSDITDEGYGDDVESLQKSGASIEADLVVPDWRKNTSIPVLGNDSMDWKERRTKLQAAVDWLRNEISEMKRQDQLLMCQFIQLRSDIHQLKFTGSNPKSRTGNNNMSESCSELIKSPSYHNEGSTALTKFQSTMALNYQDSIDEVDMSEDEDVDDEAEAERTLTEPEYLPEYRARTMSLLPPIQQKKMVRKRKSRNKSFSAGTAENTDRGLTDLKE